ncbi:protein translocase subunit SecD [Actinophytocola sp.]|uniref:protein translocase subunit SecD n=1 Tax=Actinophytocola sp. TaxID=1872138 RepID=UPI00389A6240
MASSAGQIRPGRYLAFFVFIVVLLYGLLFGTGNHKPSPKLGIDLQGGTRVTLTARTLNGEAPSKEALNQARQIIETRVNGIGVSGTEVVLDGTNIIITVPGEEGDQAKNLGQTAQLRFRAVIGQPQAATQPASDTTSTQPTTPPASETTTPPSSDNPSVGSSASNNPQGRPAPAVAGQPASTAPSTPPATTTTTAPPSSGAADGDKLDPAILADPLVACPKYSEDVDTYAKDVKANRDSKVTTAQLIQLGRACRQSDKLAPSKDGTVQADQTTQQMAMAALDCSKPDPLVGNDDRNKPLVACDQDGTAKYILGPTFLDGTDISNAGSAPDPQGVGYVVTLDFNSSGGKTWADYTSAHVNEMAAFVLDTQVVSAPQIQGAITGQTQITGGQGGFSSAEAKDLANVLKYGSLPLSFDSSEAETVSATLGLASLKAGLIAGALGLLLVFVYCLFYYRVLGLLTMLSLVCSGVIVFAVLVLLGRWIGFTLDLAGVAGFIVAIGITADSFVIFFERLKDEIREGRTFRSAVPRAWVRGRRTILSADAVMFLAAGVLYVLAVGQVRGFAFTLGMSTVLDLVVVFLVTHPLVALASRSKFLSRPGMSGLGAVQRQASERRAAAARTVAKEA